VQGFLGLRPAGGTLHLNPGLPAAWEQVAVRLRFHGCRVRVRASHDRLGLEADGPLPVAVAGQPARTVAPPGGQLAAVGEGLGGGATMGVILAAMDASAAARPVLDTARIMRLAMGPRSSGRRCAR